VEATEAKRKLKRTSKTTAPVATAIIPAAIRSRNPLTEHEDLEFSTIIDAIDPTATIIESLARLFQHMSKNPSDYPSIAQIRNESDTTEDPLQLVIAYNHTKQARVEGTIGCVEQHSRTSLLHAGKPTRFWDNATNQESIPLGFTRHPRQA